MSAEAEPIYDTAADVGRLVRLSSKTIYRMAAQDPTFPSLRVGGSVRFPRDRVLRWFRDREQGRRSRAERERRGGAMSRSVGSD